MPLILADRINVFEGLIDDIKRGQFPNIIKERGLAVEWKYNRTGLIKKVATVPWSVLFYSLCCAEKNK